MTEHVNSVCIWNRYEHRTDIAEAPIRLASQGNSSAPGQSFIQPFCLQHVPHYSASLHISHIGRLSPEPGNGTQIPNIPVDSDSGAVKDLFLGNGREIQDFEFDAGEESSHVLTEVNGMTTSRTRESVMSTVPQLSFPAVAVNLANITPPSNRIKSKIPKKHNRRRTAGGSDSSRAKALTQSIPPSPPLTTSKLMRLLPKRRHRSTTTPILAARKTPSQTQRLNNDGNEDENENEAPERSLSRSDTGTGNSDDTDYDEQEILRSHS